VNYYSRHVGDYAKDAGHLSLMEHGVYSLLLDRYYASEKPISKKDAMRIAHAKTEEEKVAVETVLNEFFKLDGDLYRSKRADEEIAKYLAQIDHNRNVGKLGGRPRKPGRNPEPNPEGTQVVPVGNPDHNPEHNPDVTRNLTRKEPGNNPSHKPLANKKKKDSLVPTDKSVGAILTAYHSALPHCKRISVIAPDRLKRLSEAEGLAKQVCVSQGWEYEAEDFWPAYFGKCAEDPWMRGEVPNPKNAKWRQHLFCLIAEERFAEIMDQAIASMKEAA